MIKKVKKVQKESKPRDPGDEVCFEKQACQVWLPWKR